MQLSGTPFDYLVAFAGGVLMSLTPCVYPLIPITAGFVGVQSAGSRLKGFSLSFVYVTGIALVYSVLGTVAVYSGQLFGVFSKHPLIHIIAGTIIIIFGIAMLDVFSFSLPQLVHQPKFKEHNYLSAFLLGLVSGLMIGPCLTPVLGGILIYVSTKESAFYGATLLLSFAYGMGLILMLIGTFSAILLKLPKSRAWMNYIRKVFGLVFIGIGIYFVFLGLRRIL
ncbi:MAG: cytochrome c biogenesis protein CcdA [Candidatus Omnitrophota bacterium]